MKKIMPQLVGNRALAERLGGEILSGGMSHAYIIAGDKGSGKHTLARLIAASLACESKKNEDSPLPCNVCESCRKILAGISPDVITVGTEDRATLGVETIRNLRLDILTHPNDLDIKVYIIEDADKMTVQAQNAFLLTLEEPPPYVLFLLLCERPKELLETIRSRAPIIRTEPVSSEEIAKFLEKDETMQRLKNDSPDEFFEVVMAAFGRIGQALALCDPEVRSEILLARSHVKSFVLSAAKRSGGAALIDIIQAFPQARAELAERLSLIALALRDLALLKKSEDAPLCFYYDREAAIELSDSFTLSAIMTLISHCESARLAVLRNANIKLTLTNLVMRGNYGK